MLHDGHAIQGIGCVLTSVCVWRDVHNISRVVISFRLICGGYLASYLDFLRLLQFAGELPIRMMCTAFDECNMNNHGMDRKLQRIHYKWNLLDKCKIDSMHCANNDFFSLDCGCAQGSSWSPWKGIIYSHVMQVEVNKFVSTSCMVRPAIRLNCGENI